MLMSGPIQNRKASARALFGLGLILTALFAGASASAQDGRQLESIDVQSLPGQRLQLRLQLNEAAPEFALDDYEGRPVRLADYRGERHVVLVLNRGFL